MNKKILIILLVGLLVFSSISWAINNEIKIKQRKLKEIQSELNELNNKISVNKNEQEKILNEVYGLETKVRSLEKAIESLNIEIQKITDEIKSKEEELEKENIVLNKKKDLLAKRLRVMYKAGQIGYIEVLLGSDNWSDLLNRLDMVKTLVKHDQELITEVKDKINTIKNIKSSLKQKNITLNETKVELGSNREDLEYQIKLLKNKKYELKQNQLAMEQLEDQLVRDANRVKEIIKNLELKATYVGGKMMWPVPSNYTITSAFGYRIHPIYKKRKLHTGLDIDLVTGDSVVAANNGTVVYSDWLGTYGKAVMIDHGGGYVTLYAHNSSLLVSPGEEVNRGQAIAKGGNTGASTGSHLHFEVRINGEYKDPLEYLKK